VENSFFADFVQEMNVGASFIVKKSQEQQIIIDKGRSYKCVRQLFVRDRLVAYLE
jgi:hypothetical protein